jgi:hypothetical protein
MGAVESLVLENGSKRLRVDLEVADLGGDEELIIGEDLFRPLGYTIQGVPFTWPEIAEELSVPDASLKLGNEGDQELPESRKRIQFPEGVDELGRHPSWLPVLADNANISVSARCKLPGACVSIDTGDAKPVWVRQYPVPEGRKAAVTKRVNEWLGLGWIIPAPADCAWNIPLVAADKPSSDDGPPGVRVCLDARLINNILLTEIDNNLPGCRELLDALGNFEWITKIDLADCYHQFELKESDRVKTAFTWDGVQ